MSIYIYIYIVCIQEIILSGAVYAVFVGGVVFPWFLLDFWRFDVSLTGDVWWLRIAVYFFPLVLFLFLNELTLLQRIDSYVLVWLQCLKSSETLRDKWKKHVPYSYLP